MRGVSRLALLQAAVVGVVVLAVMGGSRPAPPRGIGRPVRRPVAEPAKRNARDQFRPGANFSKGKLVGADLRGCRLTQVFLFEADLSGADLRGCAMVGVDLTDAKLERA